MHLPKLVIVSLLVVAPVVAGQEAKKAAQEAPKAPKTEVPDRATLEQRFAERLSGAVLVGHYSIDGQNDDKPPREERYTLSKVRKLNGEYWEFTARIQYGDLDLNIPLHLEVKWAGDTPVITLTDLTIPALGTFTARVLIYRDRYAGTWQHDQVGGNLWGRIEKAKNGQPAKKQSS